MARGLRREDEERDGSGALRTQAGSGPLPARGEASGGSPAGVTWPGWRYNAGSPTYPPGRQLPAVRDKLTHADAWVTFKGALWGYQAARGIPRTQGSGVSGLHWKAVLQV